MKRLLLTLATGLAALYVAAQVAAVGLLAWIYVGGYLNLTRHESWERAPEALPVLRRLEREHVTFLRLQGWCQAYDDGSGVKADTPRSTCTLTRDAQVFDDATRARYDALTRAAEGLPYPVDWVELAYDRDGRITRAFLSLGAGFSRQVLVYEPGYSTAEPSSEYRYEPIDADWYTYREDWD